MSQTYQMPELGADVKTLTRENNRGETLGPTTEVLCIHRGRHVLVDKFDGIDYRIEPGRFITTYGAAKHFQDRAVIPGTRNPEMGNQQSYIGIIGVDSEADCLPLTDDEVERFGAAREAIDRSALVDNEAREVNYQTTKGGGQARRAEFGNKRPRIDAPAEAFEKPETTLAQEDAAEARAERKTLSGVNSRVRRGPATED